MTMPTAYAGCICQTHVPAAYARTDGRTYGELFLPFGITLTLGNARRGAERNV